MKPLKYYAFGITDVGSFYPTDEDNFLYKIVEIGHSMAGICAIADGVGGESQGDVASAAAISAINDWFNTEFKDSYTNPTQMKSTLMDCFSSVNRELLNMSAGKAKKIATTLSVLVFAESQYLIVHTGDSRIYQLHHAFFHTLNQITVDQSVSIRKYVNGQSVKKNFLTECLGNKEVCNVFTQVGRIRENDLFLLCSDGLYKKTTSKQIRSILKEKPDLKTACKALIDYAKQCGEEDNLTAIVLAANR